MYTSIAEEKKLKRGSKSELKNERTPPFCSDLPIRLYGGIKISSKKYLRKNEFRYNTNPEVKNPSGEGHTAYVSAKHGHKSKINIITHSKTFYGESTVKMSKNPNRESRDSRPSRFSVPRWESDTYLKEYPRGYWKINKADKIAIKKFNKKYEKK